MVARAEPRSLVVSDMPYGSFHVSVEKSVENACRCVKEGGAEAVKLEGGRKRFKVIEALLDAEMPVLAHLGLTPQSVHQLGGFKVQGKLREKAREIYQDALDLEKLGVFAIVLESIPQELAQKNQRQPAHPHHRHRRRPRLRRPGAGLPRPGGLHRPLPAQIRAQVRRYRAPCG